MDACLMAFRGAEVTDAGEDGVCVPNLRHGNLEQSRVERDAGSERLYFFVCAFTKTLLPAPVLSEESCLLIFLPVIQGPKSALLTFEVITWGCICL